MATWADRRDAAVRYNREQQRIDNALAEQKANQNALNQIFARNVEEPTQEQTVPLYGPTQTGEALAPGVIPASKGGLNFDKAISDLYKSGHADVALKIQEEMLRRQGDVPSSVRETMWFQQQPEQTQQTHERLKRAQQIMNLGGTQAVLSPGGGIREQFPVTPRPEQLPSFQYAVAREREKGTELGKEESLSADMKASLPRLEEVVNQLSALGKGATYTKTGQALDIARRELGMNPRESAIARKEYIAKVDNEVLPLLRQTFGAQFTQKEGESLKLTLGDPNATPEEKDAVLRSFIDAKRSQIETKNRRIGGADVPEKTEGKIPKGARTGTDENGNKVWSMDGGNTVFDANTGKRIK